MRTSNPSQWSVLRRDGWLLSSLTWVPLLIALCIWWIFSQSIPRELPVGVVDLQQSPLSRQLIREIDATAALTVNRSYTDIYSAKTAFVGSQIYAYLIIPKNFDRDIYIGNPPQVTVFYNSQFILVGKLINSAVQQAHATFNAQIGTLKELNKGEDTTGSALAKTLSIRSQIVPLFNKNSNYAQFLVSAVVPAIWQISIVVATILCLAANQRIYGLQRTLGDAPFRRLLCLALFYLPFFLAQGLAFLVSFYLILAWPLHGSLLTLFFAQTVTAIASMIMGALFFFVLRDPTKAISVAAAFTAPSFAYMGITFPVTDMNALARGWRSLLPISHYIEAQIGQSSYGATAWKTISDFTPAMAGYLIPLLLVLLLVKRQHKRQDEPLEAA
jgi:ABC-2 type transport system permease protein